MSGSKEERVQEKGIKKEEKTKKGKKWKDKEHFTSIEFNRSDETEKKMWQ